MILLVGVDASSLLFAVIFLKCRCNINFLQVAMKIIIQLSLIQRWCVIIKELRCFSLFKVYLFQWKEYAMVLASQQAGITVIIIIIIICKINIGINISKSLSV